MKHVAPLESVSVADVRLCGSVFSKEWRVSVNVFACVFLKVSCCLSVPIGPFRALVSMMSLLSESDPLRLFMILSLISHHREFWVIATTTAGRQHHRESDCQTDGVAGQRDDYLS